MPRRRFTRNSFALSHEPTPKPAEVFSLSGLTVIGIVCNPKTHEPALVVTDGEYVSLRSLQAGDSLRRLGRGYYEESRNEPSELTKLPRSHTPDGVVVKGMGWGTALYTALCLGAHLTDEDLVEISMWKPGDGICSWTDNRSAEADRWWSAALKIGLAEQETEEDTEREEGVDIDNDVPMDALQRYVDEGEIVYVNTISVDIEKTTERTAEYYPYKHASTERHLIASALSIEVPKGLNAERSLEFLWRAVQEDSDLVHEADPYALLALDVRGLDRASLNLLSLCFSEAGLDDKALDELQLRYDRGLDPAAESRQGRLFTPNHPAVSDVILAREAGGWDELAELP